MHEGASKWAVLKLSNQARQLEYLVAHLTELSLQQLDETFDNLSKPEHIQNEEQDWDGGNKYLDVCSQVCNQWAMLPHVIEEPHEQQDPAPKPAQEHANTIGSVYVSGLQTLQIVILHVFVIAMLCVDVAAMLHTSVISMYMQSLPYEQLQQPMVVMMLMLIQCKVNACSPANQSCGNLTI